MRQGKPKLNLMPGEELQTHKCGSTHFAMTRQGTKVRSYCIVCLDLVQETDDVEFRYSDAEARRMIREAYGGESLVLVFAEAASNRVGSGHEEAILGGESHCRVCGMVERGTANPEFHPEAYA